MPASEDDLRFLRGYPEPLLQQVRVLMAEDRLGSWLTQRYPARHTIQSDKALYRYTNELRQQYLRNAPAIDRVRYDSKLDVVRQALGLHTASSRHHGGRLVAKKEIRIASLFRGA
jgi:UTP pyrophosphatase